MPFLLDTCVLSEVWKPKPHAEVLGWLSGTIEDELFLSVMTLGEIWHGIAVMPAGRRKDRLSQDYVAVKRRFSGRVLPVSEAVAERWAELWATARRAGRALHAVDGVLAATAIVHDMSLVTRNVSDFQATGASLLNPWDE
jgi:predicted nucleic acid-binding protein